MPDRFTSASVAVFEATVAVPIWPVLSKNVTVPVKVFVVEEPLAAAMVAVNDSAVPGVNVGGVAVSVVTVAPFVAFTATEAEVDAV